MASRLTAPSLIERLARAVRVFDTQPRESDPFLRRLLRNLPGMAYRCAVDPEWTMEFVSRGCRELTGFDAADLVGNRVVAFGTLIHPADRERVWTEVQDALARDASFQLTYRIRRADGRVRWVWEQGCGVVAPGGELEAVEGFIADVTDRKELRAVVADHEAQFRALLEQALTGVYLVQDGRFRYVNEYLAEVLGYAREELLRLDSVLDIVHPEDREVVSEKLRLRLDGSLEEARYEFVGLCKDGSERDLEVHGRRIDFQGRPAVMGTLLDVTEQKRALRRHHEAQKMEALGRLATGVAHDMNNFLSVIRSTAELLLADRPDDIELAGELDHIIAGVARGAGLSRQLMNFGRAGGESPMTASVEVVLEDLAAMMTRVLGSRIDLRVDVEPDLPELSIDPSRLQQVIANLALNAGEAIQDEGTVTIVARAHGPHVLLEVRDDGVGIPEGVRAKIFEPYFTTKGFDGTGLGLASVWRIVGDAGGTIEVDSETGSGSTFRILLPAASPRGDR